LFGSIDGGADQFGGSVCRFGALSSQGIGARSGNASSACGAQSGLGDDRAGMT
jgi:hypothetical protein